MRATIHQSSRLFQPVSTLNNFPSRLRAQPRFLLWKYGVPSKDGAKPPKIPFSPHPLKKGSSIDPATWGTLAQALAAYTQGGYDGIGYVLGDGVFGIALDGCMQDGIIQPWADAIMRRLADCYWEGSPSGTGLHGIGYGGLPPKGRKRGKIEVYDRAQQKKLVA